MSIVPAHVLVGAARRMVALNPLVMCVTNRVTPQRVADLLLASGASPAMIDNPEEVPAFASISSAVYVNTGLHTSQMAALDAFKAMESMPPLVVDPVGYGASAYRNASILDFLESCPPGVIKGNSNEICGLAGVAAEGKGVDSAAGTANAIEPALFLSRKFGNCVVSVSGDHDLVVQAGEEDLVARVMGDTPMMAKVTGTGCALGGIVAAGLASGQTLGVIAAHAMYTAAATDALQHVRGPGGLSTALADSLYMVSQQPDAFLAEQRVELLRGSLQLEDESGAAEACVSAHAHAQPGRQAADWGVYAVTDDALLQDGGMDALLQSMEEGLRGGCSAVQLRFKHSSTAQVIEDGWRVKELCLRYGAAFIVDDRVDVALALDADGVHVGQGDCPAHVARRLLGPQKIVGVSTYGEEAQVRAAMQPAVAADYLGSPAVFPTPTKPGAPSKGLAMLTQTKAWIKDELAQQGRAAHSCPLVAIGGVDATNAASCVQAGADALACVRGLLGDRTTARANAAAMRAVLAQ